MNRRIFLKNSFGVGCFACFTPKIDASVSRLAFDSAVYTEALFYQSSPRGFKCMLCPRECTVNESRAGYCMVRVAIKDKLVSLNYGKPCYVNEISGESISLFHLFFSGSVLLIGAAGCNLSCLSCPVSHVSQKSLEEVVTQNKSPQDVIDLCLQKNIKTLAFGYSEPVVFYEYMLAIAKLAKRNRIRTVMSSNGYIAEEPLLELCKYLDAAIIDIKAFSDSSYHILAGGSIFPVFSTLKTIRSAKVWLEIIHQIIPGYTDHYDLIQDMCKWMIDNGYQDVPIHFNNFKPVYKLSQTDPTPVIGIQRAMDIAISAGLHFVYSDKEGIKNGTTTKCPKCGRMIVERTRSKKRTGAPNNRKCIFCNTDIAGIW